MPLSPQELECEKAFLLLDDGYMPAAARLAAIHRLYELFREPCMEQTLRETYGFSLFDYYRLTGSLGVGSLLQGAMKGSPGELAGGSWPGKLVRLDARSLVRRLKNRVASVIRR